MTRKIALWLALLLAAISPALSQIAGNATVGSVSGTNTITGSLGDNLVAYGDIQGSLIYLTPTNNNTGATTLNLNSLGAVSLRKTSSSGLTALVGGELVAGQPAALYYDGTYLDIVSSISASPTVGASGLSNSALAFTVPTNLQINATVTSNALTIAMVGNNGSNASATNPILIAFRDSTIANGDPVVVSLQSTLSFTIQSGNTMGCVSGQMCRLWVEAINNGGTVALCAVNPNSGGNIGPIYESNLQTSQSGTSGGSTAQLLYCSTSAVSSKAIRILGYVDIQETTAGTWASGPTYTQLFGPGIHKPGDVVQHLYLAYPTYGSGSNTYTLSNTAPTTSNGNLVTSQAITPQSAADVLSVRAQVGAIFGNGGEFVLFLATGSNSLATTANYVGNTTYGFMGVSYYGAAGVTSALTFSLYLASNTGNTFWNGSNTAAQFGGTANTFIDIEEIMD